MNTMFDYVNTLPDTTVAAGIKPPLRPCVTWPHLRPRSAVDWSRAYMWRGLRSVKWVPSEWWLRAPWLPQVPINAASTEPSCPAFSVDLVPTIVPVTLSNLDRNYFDRAERLRIAYERPRRCLGRQGAFAMTDSNVTVGMVATATGSDPTGQLRVGRRSTTGRVGTRRGVGTRSRRFRCLSRGVWSRRVMMRGCVRASLY